MFHRLPIARAIGCALRLAAHPGKALVQLQKDIEQVLSAARCAGGVCGLHRPRVGHCVRGLGCGISRAKTGCCKAPKPREKPCIDIMV